MLVYGFVIDRVQTADQIPHLDCIASNDLVARVKSIKTHLREWELRTTKRIKLAWSEIDWLMPIMEKRLVEFKGSLLHRLCESNATDGRFLWCSRELDEFNLTPVQDFGYDYESVSELKRQDLIHQRKLISKYEAWMQCIPSSEQAEQQSQGICRLCAHSCEGVEEGICAHCVVGQEICRRVAGRTIFFTDKEYTLSDSLAVQEGDIICLLLSSTSSFVMRKADEIHWTLVGTLHISPTFDKLNSWRVDHIGEATARDQLKTFRLR